MVFPTTHPALARALETRGYETPTAVQLAVLADAAAGRDLLVSAQTGSGKTVAFGLALGSTLLGALERLPATTAPLALIVAPTRELAMQVARELTWLYEATGARVITCVGGMDSHAEARQLEAGPHIVVGTPGRLRDHLERRRLDLSRLCAVVLDEADEMLDLGFREDLEVILDATPAERRTLLFSATLPRSIETLAGRYQRDALRIESGRGDTQHADIEYQAHRVSPHDVERAVVNVLRLHDARAALVFCATREAVNRFNSRLVERGFASVALSGELTQQERTRALQALRDGRARVLVATDVAARGLDLPDLALVIHADLPNDGETLLHRSGRTGRAGRKGLCVLIVPFNRRRKADAVIAAARLEMTWRPAPTPEAVRARDQERFLADPSFTAVATEDEAQLAQALQGAHSGEQIALALVRMHRAHVPAPEDLTVDAGPPPRRAWQPMETDRGAERRTFAPRARDAQASSPPQYPARTNGSHKSDALPERDARSSPRPDSRAPAPRRDAQGPMTWYRIDIGRDRNADPRWLLPLICRAGGVTKSEIGAIRVDERETRFQILSEAADTFDDNARADTRKEARIERVDGAASCGDGGFGRPVERIAPSSPRAPAERPADRGPSRRPNDAGKPHKAPWRDRAKARGGPAPRPGGPGSTPPGPRADGAARGAAKPASSKYAKKKKHRGAVPADRDR